LKAALYRNLPHTGLYYDIKSIPDWETIVKPNYRVPLTLPYFFESCSWLMKYFLPLEILPNKNILSKMPILYIAGANDTYLHIDKHKKIYDEIALVAPPNAKMEFKVINNCGHLPQDEKPQETLDYITDFLFRVGI
jgi:pimeloyl-ACP methyl ester carboxylesterase